MIITLFYYLFLTTLFIALIPLQVFIGFIIATTTGFPILFKQYRIGRNNRPFLIYKFRTMNAGAENKQKDLSRANEAQGPVFKIHNDPRFTPFGRFLSHTGLDELPQFINVLKGDMSLVGPRPLPVTEAKKLKRWQQERHRIKPGIISPWVLNGYHSSSFDEWMKSDIIYAEQKSPARDVVLFLNACLFWFFLVMKNIFQPRKQNWAKTQTPIKTS